MATSAVQFIVIMDKIIACIVDSSVYYNSIHCINCTSINIWIASTKSWAQDWQRLHIKINRCAIRRLSVFLKSRWQKMDSRQLIYFLRVCEYSNITQAAQSLYISPQALSKAIARLEDEFRMPLFLRTVHGLVLTEAGKLLQKLGQPIADSLDDLSLRMSGLYQQTHHHFTLGITSHWIFSWGNMRLICFAGPIPPIRLRLQSTPIPCVKPMFPMVFL